MINLLRQLVPRHQFATNLAEECNKDARESYKTRKKIESTVVKSERAHLAQEGDESNGNESDTSKNSSSQRDLLSPASWVSKLGGLNLQN